MKKIYVVEEWVNVVEDQYSYIDARQSRGFALTTKIWEKS